MSEIDELFSFLSDSKLNVIYEALKICLDLTGNSDNFQFFKVKTIMRIMELTKEEVLVSNAALSILINLSKDLRLAEIIGTKGFLYELVLMIMIPTNVNADLGCMLLANLSKLESVCNRLLPAGEEAKTEILDNLLDIFVKGDLQVWNKSANFDFLAGVFGNITTCPQGCQFFLHKSTMDSSLRITKLMVFTEHGALNRRGGCIGAIKNICYSANLSQKGVGILLDPTLNLLVYSLLPLMGSEDYDDDEMEGMPDDLQLLEPEKKRESDPKLKVMLLETLLAIGTTKQGREYLRSIKTYPIVKKLHLVEKDDDVLNVIEELVNLLCRDDPEDHHDHNSSVIEE